MKDVLSKYSQVCNLLKERSIYRSLAPVHPMEAQGMIDFSSNDYLRLSKHPRLISSAINHLSHNGIGSTGSRLLSGNHELFNNFEILIAHSKKTEAALIFNSGYQANASALSALLDQKVLQSQALVFADKLVHASIYSAIFTTNAELFRYGHLQLAELEDELAKYANDPRPKFIVSETVFGMDGDVIDLGQLIKLALKYDTFIYLDEAHATGMIGEGGYGLSTLHNFGSVPHCIMGTFSKALGNFGGYVATSALIKEYFVNKAGGFIYTTALPPMIIASAMEAWLMLPELDEMRSSIAVNALKLKKELSDLGFDCGSSATNIVPIVMRDENRTLTLQEMLRNAGIIVSAIRPPTVLPNSSRLRLAVNSSHTEADIMRFIAVIKDCKICN